jgi:hypothetical protein
MAKNNNSITWMMWQVDKSQKTNSQQLNLIRAIQFYTDKYGGVPNRAKLPDQWAGEIKPPEGMVVEYSKTIQNGQLMLSIDVNEESTRMIKARKKK